MDLFSTPDSDRRAKLTALNWQPVPLRGGSYWRRPDGVIVTEEEAFRQLEAMEDNRDR